MGQEGEEEMGVERGSDVGLDKEGPEIFIFQPKVELHIQTRVKRYFPPPRLLSKINK